jgi:hypothetical protein
MKSHKNTDEEKIYIKHVLFLAEMAVVVSYRYAGNSFFCLCTLRLCSWIVIVRKKHLAIDEEKKTPEVVESNIHMIS